MADRLAKTLCALSLALKSLAAWAGAQPAGVPNSFVFHDPGYYSPVPITVYYYKSSRADADSPVVFSLHGAERDGKRALAIWMGAAERHKLIVVAPEFDRSHFPNKLYQMGGLGQNDPAKWTFPIIENIFSQVRRDNRLNASSYILFGHSAGGQFVHRFMLMMDQPRVSVAVAANAGGYLWPNYAHPASEPGSPWALDERLLGRDQLKQAFGRKLIVLLGEADILSGGTNYPNSPEVQAQGANRLERGRNFFAAAQSQAKKLGTPFDWQLVTVPKVGHDAKGMAKATAKLLF